MIFSDAEEIKPNLGRAELPTLASVCAAGPLPSQGKRTSPRVMSGEAMSGFQVDFQYIFFISGIGSPVFLPGLSSSFF